MFQLLFALELQEEIFCTTASFDSLRHFTASFGTPFLKLKAWRKNFRIWPQADEGVPI